YFFEASVGGGIPIIRPMHQCLTANNIIRIAGILNGTTNYILNQMIKSGQTFDAALKDAQAKGFAERNPAADIEGHDACRKIAILTSLASGLTVDYNDIETKGITDITLDDVNYAAQMDAVIKLIGFAEFQEDGKIYSIVSPMVVKNDSPLSGVDGVMNAIMVTGDCVGNVMFYGAGAGKLPTASAVVADVVDAVKHIERSKKIMWVEPKENIMANSDSKKFAYFIRTTDNAENIRGIFGKCEFVDNIVSGESAFVTEPMSQSDAEEKSGKLKDVVSMIKVLD
ncbi:MAG: homoserine dehydrogenase, partial [Clostridia bacterium]|nr:homoserine dehydrogenase [Clostridia bacterium]